MIKIVNVGRTPIVFNTETCDVKGLKSEYQPIDSIYIVPEDAKLHWENKFKDSIDDVDVNKNDIIITFYNRDFGTDYVVVKSEGLLNAINNYKAADQKRKEEWAAKKTQVTESCGNCDECHYCSNKN